MAQSTSAVVFVCAVMGCSGSSDEVSLFFCGCTPCSELVRELGASSFERATVYYAGSLGDAREFGLSHSLGSVKADPARVAAKEMGVDTCPSVVIGYRDAKVIGNGIAISEQDMEDIRNAVGD